MVLSLVFVVVVTVVAILPFWYILGRMGYSPYTCLLLLLPFLNIGFLYYVAFTDWPIERKLNSRA
ncbi:MAG: hypothetical protein ACHQZQ_02785 [SAR324 cluster bacterium]